jgi:hypothetical protein
VSEGLQSLIKVAITAMAGVNFSTPAHREVVKEENF